MVLAHTKRKAGGSVEFHKARLVAKGFNQITGEDFFETFSLVVKPTTIRLLLYLALWRDWVIRQLNIHNAFLNGNLSKAIYVSASGLRGQGFPKSCVFVTAFFVWSEISTLGLIYSPA